MFGNKQENLVPEPQLDVAVTTIPTDFYAGANPTISFKQVEKVVQANEKGLLTPADKKALDKATATGSGQEMHPVNVLGNRKKLILIGGGLFGLFIVGTGSYYWLQSKPPAVVQNQVPVVVDQTPVIVDTTSSTPVISVDTSSTEQIVASTKASDDIIEFPSMLLSKSADSDNDGLTDQEEDIYKSDSSNPDTDSDGYLDGSEVFHLYNPTGKEPIKLIESEVVQQFDNPTFGYSLYYPINWVPGNVNLDYRDMLFTAVSGENIEVRVFDKNATETFADWFGVNAPDQKYGDLTSFETRFTDKGSRRYDKLAYYFATPTHVFILVYHPTIGATTINFAATLEMMARSFKNDGQSFEEITTQQALTSPLTELPPVVAAPPAEASSTPANDSTTAVDTTNTISSTTTETL